MFFFVIPLPWSSQDVASSMAPFPLVSRTKFVGPVQLMDGEILGQGSEKISDLNKSWVFQNHAANLTKKNTTTVVLVGVASFLPVPKNGSLDFVGMKIQVT